MAAFAGADGTTVIVRNHEITYEPKDDPRIIAVPAIRPYDSEGMGGTVVIVVDANHNMIDSFVTSSGTLSNCAGGTTP